MFPARDASIVARFVDLPTGVRLRIACAGPEDATPVVALPGWGSSLYMYRHALGLLPPRGIRVIAVDLRGMGLAEKPRERGSYSLNNYLADLDALLDALELERAALIGQSMGGAIALHYALRHASRVERLTLVNPAGLVRIGIVPLARLVPPALLDSVGRRAVPRRLIAFILRRLAYADSSRVTARDIDEYWAPTQLPGYVHGVRATLGEFDWRPVDDDLASTLRVPTLVILGEQDRLIDNDPASAARLANTRVWQTAGGHCAHEEHPEVVYAEVARFLQQVGERYH
jgi:pimeloyl-ACP methyl ester carboxylesterase